MPYLNSVNLLLNFKTHMNLKYADHKAPVQNTSLLISICNLQYYEDSVYKDMPSEWSERAYATSSSGSSSRSI